MKISHAIILSLLGHGILLISWPNVADFSVASTFPSYQVRLLESLSKNTPEKTIQKRISQDTNTANITNREAKKNKSIKPALDTQSNIENSQKSSEIKAYVISRINYKIRNNFKYPQLARKNGWEGKVLLSLFVNSEGTIENAHIKTSSGYRILDKSALNALLKVKHIPRIKNWFNISYSEIIIPVIYQLQKG